MIGVHEHLEVTPASSLGGENSAVVPLIGSLPHLVPQLPCCPIGPTVGQSSQGYDLRAGIPVDYRDTSHSQNLPLPIQASVHRTQILHQIQIERPVG